MSRINHAVREEAINGNNAENEFPIAGGTELGIFITMLYFSKSNKTLTLNKLVKIATNSPLELKAVIKIPPDLSSPPNTKTRKVSKLIIQNLTRFGLIFFRSNMLLLLKHTMT